MTENEIAKAGHVTRTDPETAAPTRTAADDSTIFPLIET